LGVASSAATSTPVRAAGHHRPGVRVRAAPAANSAEAVAASSPMTRSAVDPPKASATAKIAMMPGGRETQ
jgi:hypothetical protein